MANSEKMDYTWNVEVNYTHLALRPYEDWRNRYKVEAYIMHRPEHNTFAYAFGSKECLFAPKQKLFQLTVPEEFTTSTAVGEVEFNDKAKSVRIVKFAYKYMAGEQLHTSSLQDWLQNEFRKDFIQTLFIQPMFGDDWKVEYDHNRATIDRISFPIREFILCDPVTFGVYDDSVLDECAKKIQAAFRGWKARMQYRFSPYNNFGKFLVMKEFKACA